ncbi:MAG TPA: CDP-alcohol phosphatidyltransferase family protein [Solirubrobacterales bacterium]|jgi:CDP-diacylglycerol--serine O-phosphatidyltransferase
MSKTTPLAWFQHALANALTLANLTSGITAILLPGEGRTVRRSTLILVGALCDSVDGSLARNSGNPTEFGAAADGVSDIITCGVAPAVVLARSGPIGTRLSRVAPGFYIAAAAWRVARYGIGPRRSHVFRGLPVTGAGVLFAAGCQLRLPPRALTYLAIALGVAMLSPIRVLSGEALIRRNLETLTIQLPDEDMDLADSGLERQR